MPVLNETRSSKEIGYKSNCLYIWVACDICGKERWVKYKNGKPIHSHCLECDRSNRYGDKCNNWKGGIRKDKCNGYIYIFFPTHPESDKNKCIKRSRFVLEQKLGRPIRSDHVAHHVNRIRDDDRPENLIELHKLEHERLHNAMGKNVRPRVDNGYFVKA